MDSTFSRSCLLRVLTNYTLLLYHIKSTAPVHSQQEIRPPKVFRSGFFWGDKFSIFRFPCQTLTSNFDSYLQYLEIARLSYSMFEYYCYLYIYFFYIYDCRFSHGKFVFFPSRFDKPLFWRVDWTTTGTVKWWAPTGDTGKYIYCKWLKWPDKRKTVARMLGCHAPSSCGIFFHSIELESLGEGRQYFV